MNLHGCHWSGNGQGKQKFFKVREKSGNFILGQAKLAFWRKVRENWNCKTDLTPSKAGRNILGQMGARTAVIRNWRPLPYLKFCIYLVRKIYLLSVKSQGILKIDLCGNHDLSWSWSNKYSNSQHDSHFDLLPQLHIIAIGISNIYYFILQLSNFSHGLLAENHYLSRKNIQWYDIMDHTTHLRARENCPFTSRWIQPMHQLFGFLYSKFSIHKLSLNATG